MNINDYNILEREVITLWSIVELLDSVINHAFLKLVGQPNFQEIRFINESHQKHLNIILSDFINYFNVDAKNTFICYESLELILNNPQLAHHDSITYLKKPIYKLKDWLYTEAEFHNVWFPDITREMDLKVIRKDFIRICGNIAKHNPIKLDQIAKRIQTILRNNNIDVTLEEAYICLSNFYEWFHEDIFGYHSSFLVQMLNDIRWGIHKYLTYEHERVTVYSYDNNLKMLKWKYNTPEKIRSELARFCYWELMSKVRSKPYLQEFVVNEVFKLRY